MTTRTIPFNDVGDDDEEEETLSPLRSLKTRRGSHRMVNPDVAKSALKEKVVYDYDVKGYVHEKPLRTWIFTLPCMTKPIILNPMTTLIAMVPLWSLVLWCVSSPESTLETLLELRGKIAHSWTWFIIITKPLSLFFLMWITYKYGHIRFGGRDSQPEFGNLEYFAMIFTTGVGVGMFYYGVSEPLWHQSSHWFAEAGYKSQDEIDQMALIITIYHWGFHGFVSYLTIAIATSLASYRFRLPLIFRSTFYPILGEYCWYVYESLSPSTEQILVFN